MTTEAAAAVSKFSDEQLAAIDTLMQNRVAVLVGPPGSGKTFTLLELVRRVRASGSVVLIATPTAAAASAARLVVQRRATCSTADKLVLSSSAPSAHRRFRGATVIVDETSMASPEMLVDLLNTLRKDGEDAPCVGRLVAVGDADQLRPVRAVRVLTELMAAYPTARLTRVFRQNSESALYRNIRRIRSGGVLRVQDLEQDDSFAVVVVATDASFDFLAEYIDPTAPLPLTMCFTNEARHAAARVVQQKYNPDAIEVIDAQHAGKGAVTGLRLGDPIVCTRNKYAQSDTEEARALITMGDAAAAAAATAAAATKAPSEADAQDAEEQASEDEDEEKDDDDADENEDDGTAEKGKRDILLVANGNTGVLQMDENVLCAKYRTIAPNGYEVDFYDEMNPARDATNPFLTKFEQGYATSVHKAQGRDHDFVLGVALTRRRSPQPGLLYTLVSRAKRRCVLFTNDESLARLTQKPEEPRSAVSWSFHEARSARGKRPRVEEDHE